METRQWNVSIVETDDRFEAVITNMDSGDSLLPIVIEKRHYSDRDEAIGELFSGHTPNIRDNFDTV